jgi:hypothetical protein
VCVRRAIERYRGFRAFFRRKWRRKKELKCEKLEKSVTATYSGSSRSQLHFAAFAKPMCKCAQSARRGQAKREASSAQRSLVQAFKSCLAHLLLIHGTPTVARYQQGGRFPLPLSVPSKTHPPRHTRRGGEEREGRTELLTGPFHDPRLPCRYSSLLVEFNLERYTVNRPKIEQQSCLCERHSERVPKMDTSDTVIPESKGAEPPIGGRRAQPPVGGAAPKPRKNK